MHAGMTKCRVLSWVSVTLTSDLVSRISIESGAYLLYSLRKYFKIRCVNASIDGEVSHTFLSHYDSEL